MSKSLTLLIACLTAAVPLAGRGRDRRSAADLRYCAQLSDFV